jgi:hypothetical protein
VIVTRRSEPHAAHDAADVDTTDTDLPIRALAQHTERAQTTSADERSHGAPDQHYVCAAEYLARGGPFLAALSLIAETMRARNLRAPRADRVGKQDHQCPKFGA